MADQALRPSARAGAAESFEFRLWGGFAASRLKDGADLTPRSRKARALLAYLLIERLPTERDRLAGLLWSERGHEQARASLRQCLSDLRDFSSGASPLLLAERQQLRIDAARASSDLDQMLALAEEGQADALADRLAGRDGTLLQGLDGLDPAFDEWLRPTRAQRTDTLLAAAQHCARRALEAGEADAACRLIQALQAIDPLDETVARLAMEVGDGLGRRDYVQRVYDRLQEDLSRELGIGPSAETRALRERLLEEPQGRPAAAPVPEEPPPQPLGHEAVMPETAQKPRTRRWWALAMALLLAAALAAAWWQTRPAAPTEPVPLAVLPFRNLAPGDDYFAEGLAEEILTQLSREPELRVAGRTSAWQFKDRADLGEIRRRLDVDYVLEGSVRTAADRVRVNVALVRTDDGSRLWTRAFDGRLDDIFRIQDDIGAAVAASLKRRLVYAGTPDASLRTSGEVYSLYLTARGLIRERTPTSFKAAGEQLRRAIAIDPSFAPLWSSLAQVTNYYGKGDRRVALAQAERALKLAPDLAQAHGVVGMLNDFSTVAGRSHIKRAAALEPNNAEFQFWLGHVYSGELDFPKMLDAYRRALAIDPLWGYAQEYAVNQAWQMGYRDEAMAYVLRVERDGSPYQAHKLRGVLAGARGDFSEELKEYTLARQATADRGQKAATDYERYLVFSKLRLFEAARQAKDVVDLALRRTSNSALEENDHRSALVVLRQGKVPTPEAFKIMVAADSHEFEADIYLALAMKLLINDGRARDLISLYDGRQETISGRTLTQARRLEDGPLVAVALRASGRGAEAERLLARLDGEIAAALRRGGGTAPAPFFASAAQTWALRGKRQAALAALERAMRDGWAYTTGYDESSLEDFGDEPAFRSLRGDPRFENIRARINGHVARERREAAALQI